MAEMRPAGLTEDGTALRLTDQDGGEHTLPLTDEVRSLVAGGSGEGSADSPAASSAPEKHDDGRPASTGDVASAEGPQEGTGSPADADSSDSSSSGSSDPTTAASSASSGASSPGSTGSASAAGSRTDSARAAAGLPRPGSSTRPGADAADEVPAAHVSPREIQTRIRAGATAEEVAEATGASLARVRIFEYPVLAERAWIAQQVQQLEVWVGGPDLYSSTVEDGGPSTLGELVSHRLQELGLDADAVTWDAWREGPGPWTVVADFSLEGLRSKPTQEQPPARFAFRQGAKHVDHVNRWAQLLADAETWNISSARSKDDETPFDVEAGDAPERPAAEPTALHPDTAPDPDEELLDILRARRGQRLGADEESDDALALMLTRDETPTPQPPAKPTLAAADDTGAGSAPSAEQTEYLWDDEDAEDDGPLASVHAFRSADSGRSDDADRTDARDEEAATDQDTPQTRADAPATHESDEAPAPQTPAQAGSGSDEADEADEDPQEADPDTGESAEEKDAAEKPRTGRPSSGRGTSRGRIADVLIKDTSEPKPGAEKKSTRSKSSNRRASVPSWDEIVFGRKND